MTDRRGQADERSRRAAIPESVLSDSRRLRRHFRVSATPDRRFRLERLAGCAFSAATQSLQCVGRLFLQVRKSVPQSDALNCRRIAIRLIRKPISDPTCDYQTGSDMRGRHGVGSSGLCRSFLSAGSSPILKAKRRAGAVFDADSWRRFVRLERPGGSRARTREPGFGRRARGPGIRQTIDPMRGQEITPAQKARTGFEPFRSSGRAPALHPCNYLTISAFEPYPFVFAMRGGNGRFPSACEASFVQR
jgi:hypothetical protein